jgi:RNA polymerase sigma-70 factor (ECF subfamily)
VRLSRLLVELIPDEPEAGGLLALLLLTEARRAARVVADGSLVLLPDQDRTRWDGVLIEEGHTLVRACLRRNQTGPYQIQAAINAVHTDAARAEATDWAQILARYDQLLVYAPTAVVSLNRAVALSEVSGPEAGLLALEELDLAAYHPYHAARADFLARLGRDDEARAAYDTAIGLTENEAEREALARQRDALMS